MKAEIATLPYPVESFGRGKRKPLYVRGDLDAREIETFERLPLLGSTQLLLKFSAAATAFGSGTGPHKRHLSDELTQQQRDSLTPQQIIEAMKNGNARFRSGEKKDRNYLREQQASASGQHPKAALAKDIAITLLAIGLLS